MSTCFAVLNFCKKRWTKRYLINGTHHNVLIYFTSNVVLNYSCKVNHAKGSPGEGLGLDKAATFTMM